MIGGIIGIGGLDTTDATANANEILLNRTAYVNDQKITGTMPNNGTLQYAPNINSQTIPAGYTSGGTISAVTNSIDNNIQENNIKSGVTILGTTGTFTNDANITSGVYVLEGAIVYGKNGRRIQGNMTNRGNATFTPSTGVQSGASGYYSSITVNAMPKSPYTETDARYISLISDTARHTLNGVELSADTYYNALAIGSNYHIILLTQNYVDPLESATLTNCFNALLFDGSDWYLAIILYDLDIINYANLIKTVDLSSITIDYVSVSMFDYERAGSSTYYEGDFSLRINSSCKAFCIHKFTQNESYTLNDTISITNGNNTYTLENNVSFYCNLLK